MAEKLNATLMENLITLLCHSDEHGKIIANMIDANLFEGDYRVIAERAIAYHRQYGEAPKQHTADLVAEILDDPHHRKANVYRRILLAMDELIASVNTKYVMDQLRMFTRTQRFKDAVLKSAEQLESQQELAIGEVEEIWNEILHTRNIDFDAGLRLDDFERVVVSMEKQFSEFTLGIPDLDRRMIVPYRGSVMLFLAPTGTGKSWFLVNVGKEAILQRKKVLHLVLEMSEEETGQRYYQCLFSVPKHASPHTIISKTFDLDSQGRLTDFGEVETTPEFHFESPYIRDDLAAFIDAFGRRIKNIVIKAFPMRGLSISMLRAYIDNLESAERFIPDIILLDSINLMETDPKLHRLHMGRNMEGFIGLCEERNCAGVTVSQVSKAGAFVARMTLAHVAEDWSLTNSASQVLLYTSTESEQVAGLGRIYVGKARSEKGRFGVMLTQSYATGQFCLESMLMQTKYLEVLERMKRDGKESDNGDDDENENEEAED